ncbi:chemotaxis-specific protein-glutamate methyltransferase CheB [Paludisphaera borealis]|uniref:Protein-glutamate methylesterase/protein-glutamine glutaminase n=1 Tax=Paludisphaera borealis TaxID=1387353 RepID=A0A1U7CQS6_9BACT|nr:chemotaxis-specific protein-glutamate methyltransferase CheB [Paludisphaera borealis]APW61258.1 Chemotaxis response regulator protein-glutamate methylesterase of group 3 operon [Paludisphaera borealis]
MALRDRSKPPTPPTHPPSIEVMVVDDSAVIRQRLKSIIESDPRFRVSLAADPYEAVAMLSKSVPGVIVLDVEMPRMDGLTFLRKLMRQHPMPVVLCTSVADRAVTALEMGAIEVIAKPNWLDAARLSEWSESFLESIRNAARAGRLPFREDRGPSGADPRYTADVILPPTPYSPRGGSTTEPLVVVGVSTGGVQAIQQLLAGFPLTVPGIVIVQHMPADFTGAFADRLDKDSRIKIGVSEARHHDPVRPGHALIIPGGTHGLVKRTGSGYRVELQEGPPVCLHRPSVEVLFRSAAQAAGPLAAGVIMTGMGDDGAGGLLEMREAGSLTIAQNEASCVVFGMPREAIRRGAAKYVVPLDSIANTIMAWVVNPEAGTWH